MITSQNHGYAVDEKSLEGKNIEITNISLNDYTIEACVILTTRPLPCSTIRKQARGLAVMNICLNVLLNDGRPLICRNCKM